MPVTFNGVLQVLIFLALCAAADQTVGPVYDRRLHREAHLAHARLRARRAPVLPAVRHQSRGRTEVDRLRHRHAGLQRGRHAAAVSASSAPSSGTWPS